MPNVHEIIRDHVSLSITCVDRLYINGYLPGLQTSGQLCYFLKEHLGNPIPSPALLGPMHDTFVAGVNDFASRHDIPIVQFERGQHRHRAKLCARLAARDRRYSARLRQRSVEPGDLAGSERLGWCR